MSKEKNAIDVRGLSKIFRVPQKGQGIWSRLIHPRFDEVEAVRNLSFSIAPGERVAFVGPNGAGKSTTIKILCGILHPSAGEATVSGFVPWVDRISLARRIGTVFGQRSQLWYHLPARDTFSLLAYAYELDRIEARKRTDFLIESFDATALVDKPVRQLSLGERMRCEIIASLIHRPQVLFLDEPTVGLDVVSKGVIRDLVRRMSEEDGTTVLLTSHDTGDMERVCDRVLVIDHGGLVTDQKVKDLKNAYIREKVVTMALRAESISLDLPGVRILETAPYHLKLAVTTGATPLETLLQHILSSTGFEDVSIEDPAAEDIIKEIYRLSGQNGKGNGS